MLSWLALSRHLPRPVVDFVLNLKPVKAFRRWHVTSKRNSSPEHQISYGTVSREVLLSDKQSLFLICLGLMLFIYSLLLKIFSSLFLPCLTCRRISLWNRLSGNFYLTGHIRIPKPWEYDLMQTDSLNKCNYFKDPFLSALTVNLMQPRVTSVAQEEVLIEELPRADWQVSMFVKNCLVCHNEYGRAPSFVGSTIPYAGGPKLYRKAS